MPATNPPGSRIFFKYSKKSANHTELQKKIIYIIIRIMNQPKKSNKPDTKPSGTTPNVREVSTELNQTKLMTCEFCSYETTYYSNFIRHKKCHPTEAQSQSSSTVSRKSPGRPLKFPGGTRKFIVTCSKCPQTFCSNRDKRKHERAHGDKFPCQFCPTAFDDIKFLPRHLFAVHPNIETRAEPNQLQRCTLCTYIAKRPSLLIVHMRLHSLERNPSACKFCSQTFITDDYLERHVAERCPYLKGVTKEEKADLERPRPLLPNAKTSSLEMQSDTAQKEAPIPPRKVARAIKPKSGRFQCSVCVQSFLSVETKRAHEMTHGDAFFCEVCPGKIGFLFIQGLRNHQRLVHTPNDESTRKYKCSKCNQSFTHKGGMQKHEGRHGPGHPCPICTASFTTERQLKVHLKNSNNHLKTVVSRPQTKEIVHPKTERPVNNGRSHRRKCLGISLPLEIACSSCSDVFESVPDLREHMNSAHQHLKSSHLFALIPEPKDSEASTVKTKEDICQPSDSSNYSESTQIKVKTEGYPIFVPHFNSNSDVTEKDPLELPPDYEPEVEDVDSMYPCHIILNPGENIATRDIQDPLGNLMTNIETNYLNSWQAPVTVLKMEF